MTTSMTGTRRRSVQWVSFCLEHLNLKYHCLLGLIFCQKYNFALIEVQECIDDLINFEASLAADQLVEWRDIEAWEADCSQPNPFEGRAMMSTCTLY
jgi:hypothetical protein